jgi:hypothetical protein
VDELTPCQLIRSGLETKAEAINSYDGIIWKIRTGYVVILYGALTLLSNKEGILVLSNPVSDIGRLLPFVFLILGLSVSCFLIDFGYLRKRIRIIVIRNLLVEIAYDLELDSKKELVKKLLNIAAETPFEKITKELKRESLDPEVEFNQIVKWNVRQILTPIYATTPFLALILCLYKIIVK